MDDPAATAAPPSDVTTWLAENWDPDLTVAQWWDRLATSGWAAPTWPARWYGRALSQEEGVGVQAAIRSVGALGAPGGLGLLLAGPTVLVHGTDDQRERHLADIVTGRKAWCQLFSEPGAGSDLAGLSCKAERDGDEWIVNGQKVWTSAGQIADCGMLLARTDPTVPKHSGLSYFVLDMHQPGVEVRPLREMTGRSLFNEVFLTDARVGELDCIGGHGAGWRVANTTLGFERAGLGAGAGGEAGGAATPGTVARDLERRAGDLAESRHDGGGGVNTTIANAENLLVALARAHGKLDDPGIRQDLMRLHTHNEIARFTNLRVRGGAEIPGVANMAKLAMSDILRLSRDLGLRILGPLGTLHGYTSADRAVVDTLTGDRSVGMITEMALFSPGPAIYGGTDQIQRNIIGERVLGLPREPSQDRDVPFRDLPRNG